MEASAPSLPGGWTPTSIEPYAHHIRVLLVHHHPIVRQQLRTILERESDIELAGEAASGAEALQIARYRLPEVIVVDLQVSAPSGMETARAIRDICPNGRTVLVSLLTGEEYIEEAMRAGAYGFVASDSAQTDLAPAIRCAFEGKTFISRRVLSSPAQAGSQTEYP